MDGDVIQLVARQSVQTDDVRIRIKRIASLLRAIEQGELLAAAPADPNARANHQAAVDLISVITEQVQALAAEVA